MHVDWYTNSTIPWQNFMANWMVQFQLVCLEKKEEDINVATKWQLQIMVLLHFLSGLSLYVTHNGALRVT